MTEPTPDTTLAPHTTLELGGEAECYVETATIDELRDALRWASEREMPVTVLGGGSNVVISDTGVEGLVVHLALRGIDWEHSHGRTRFRVAAGEPWDEVVGSTVADNLAGLECLSGIPGSAGATPIQNVGAYGQEVAGVIDEVRVLDRNTLEERVLGPEDCGFGYRTSVLRRPNNPLIVTEVRYSLEAGGAPTLSYSQVAERFSGTQPPSLGEVRAAVLDLRRGKSMVIDDEDPNRRSVGSFFVNPVVDDQRVAELIEMARVLGVLAYDQLPPVHEVGEQQNKLSAAWLIEHAGFPRGCVRGRVGLSTKHALALINRGGATTGELIEFARDIRRGVRSHLGIDLTPEPVFLGFSSSDPTERSLRP